MHNKQRESYDRILKCVTHLIYLLLETAQSDEEKDEMRHLVHSLVRQNPKCASTEDTLLHLCVSRLNTIHSNYFTADDIQVRSQLCNTIFFKNIVRITLLCNLSFQVIFPNLEVVKLLLECRAHVNARNDLGSTPLHIASFHPNFHNSVSTNYFKNCMNS